MRQPKYTSIAVFVREELLRSGRVALPACCAHSFGKTEGSKGAVCAVLRCDSTTMAFINCHLSAGKGKGGESGKRTGQYATVVRALGRTLGLSAIDVSSLTPKLEVVLN